MLYSYYKPDVDEDGFVKTKNEFDHSHNLE